jgi:predicted CXXCH cytochrome family protein
VNEGSKLCESCHADFMKPLAAGTKHMPFTEGMCLDCHNPHASNIKGLAKDKVAVLCANCHSDIGDALAKDKTKHKPVETGDCTACHNPHQTALPKLMLAKPPDLCLNCHTTLKAAMTGTHVHSPAARDCFRCHQPHSSPEGRLMVKPVRELCMECHDVKTAAFGDAHVQIDPSIMHCERCHDPHASKDQHFFKPNSHPPFAMKTCTDCHLGKSTPGAGFRLSSIPGVVFPRPCTSATR